MMFVWAPRFSRKRIIRIRLYRHATIKLVSSSFKKESYATEFAVNELSHTELTAVGALMLARYRRSSRIKMILPRLAEYTIGGIP